MVKKIKDIINFFTQLSEGKEDVQTPQDVHAKFTLEYKDIVVGYLELEDGVWKFYYSDEFKQQHHLRTLAQFSNEDKVYKNKELWPFFKVRIPALSQPEVRNIIESEDIDDTNEVQLLKRFGKKTISDPYQLGAV